MIKKFKKHLNMLFLFYPKTRKLKEFKEELLGTLMEKYEESVAQGETSERAYKNCIAGLEDYKEPIAALAKQERHDLTLSQRKLILLSALAYVLAVVLVYIVVSVATSAWGKTWLTFIGGVIIGVIMIAYLLLKIGHKNSQYILMRLSNFVITLMVTTGIYLVVSFSVGHWDLTWITFLCGIGLGYAFDIWYRLHYRVMKFRFLDFSVLTMFFTLIIYFTLSFTLNAWAWTWVIFIAWLFLQAFGALIGKLVEYVKYNKQ